MRSLKAAREIMKRIMLTGQFAMARAQKIFHSSVFVLIFAALASCSPPRNTAIANQNLSAGAVFKGVVTRVEPIYVEGYFDAPYSEIASDIVEKIEKRGKSDYAHDGSIASNLSKVIARNLEVNASGLNCQYFITTTDRRLANAVGPFRGGGDEGEQDENIERLLSQNLSELDFSVSQLIEDVDLVYEKILDSVDNRNEFADGIRSDIDAGLPDELANYFEKIQNFLNAKEAGIDEIKKSLDREAARRESQNFQIAVVNPCRTIPEGSKVNIITSGYEFIIQPVDNRQRSPS